MKITTKIYALSFILVSFLSCDKADELTQFDINKKFSETIDVSADGEKTFSDAVTIDISSNEEIKKHLNSIEKVTVNSLSLKISNYTGADGIKITNATLNIEGISVSLSDINIKQAADSGIAIDIPDASQLNALAAILKNSYKATTTLSGTLSDVPVDFKVTLNADVTVKINAL